MLKHMDISAPAGVVRQTRSHGRARVQTKAFLPGFPTLGNKSKERTEKKEQLLDLIRPLRRGLLASDEDQQQVESLVQRLEKLNPTPQALASPLLNGRWRLEYTTSGSILGANKPALFRPSGPIYQLLDGPNLKAANRETAPFYNQVTAELTPLSANKVAVQFKTFKIFGLLPITAPQAGGRGRGELAVTYLDEELRISRGDKGNLFVLVMEDPEDRP
eukprot:jgi/Chrzof1/8490/Cz03g13020.t1